MSDTTTETEWGDRPPSGRFVLRVPPELHAALRGAAGREGLSLNEYCVRQLTLAVAPGAHRWRAGPGVEHAVEAFGDALVGCVAFGSWARGDAAESSDIDLLVVVSREVAIDRALYRRWDALRVVASDREVEAHFVHLPSSVERMTGLWAEVARDGIVLWERDYAVSRHLARVRARLLQGRFVRRTVHGQPYWQEAVDDAQP